MSHQVAEPQEAGIEHKTFVIARHERGFRVYSPEKPHDVFVVSGGVNAPTCTCAGFDRHRHDPTWRCEHIQAVFRRIGAQATQPDLEVIEERPAIQEDRGATNGATQMLLKRSVSPDGRIDSLSIEFSCPVETMQPPEVKAKASKAIALQTEIVTAFLANGRKPQEAQRAHDSLPPPSSAPTNGEPVAATLLTVGGMDTRWGRRLFINVQVNGRVLKLFGSPNQLSKAIQAAGDAELGQYVDEGMELNLPCRVTTKPSGKYVNVDRVYPAQDGSGRR